MEKGKQNRASKYISFREIPPLAKTRRWYILDKAGKPFALIKWNGAWRKYVAYFDDGVYCDSDCLELISAYLRDANKEHGAILKSERS